MAGPAGSDPRQRIEQLINEPTKDLYDWEWVFEGDHPFPVRSHRGPLGKLVVLVKRLLRPLVKAPQADLWDRQRLFNLVVIRQLHDRGPAIDALWKDLKQVRSDLLRDVRTHARRLDHLERYNGESFEDVMRYADGLFALLDQKVDRYRREGEVLWGKLGSVLAETESAGQGVEGEPLDVAALRESWDERNYVELEDRFRGTEDDIAGRAEPYVEILKAAPKGPIVDLGCGRGEALEVLGAAGLEVRGVDLSAAMVRHCRDKGLEAEEGDLFGALDAAAEGSLSGILSLHVIEHLPGSELDRLLRLAWSRLQSGGVLALENPQPGVGGRRGAQLLARPDPPAPGPPADPQVDVRAGRLRRHRAAELARLPRRQATTRDRRRKRRRVAPACGRQHQPPPRPPRRAAVRLSGLRRRRR